MSEQSAQDLGRALARLPLFRGVTERDLVGFAGRCPVRDYAPDTAVFWEGDPARMALLVVNGGLRASVQGSTGKVVLGRCRPGEMVGESALFGGTGSRNATIEAEVASVCLELGPELFERTDDPVVMALEQYLVATLARRVRATNLAVKKAWKASGAATETAAPLTLRQRLARLFGGGQ